ncbi:MAG: hypothetical protein RLZZ524_3143 [Pseudomonadota bacterium]|jgi:hypothetical protein
MSDTPETDEVHKWCAFSQGALEHASRMERERNEAMAKSERLAMALTCIRDRACGEAQCKAEAVGALAYEERMTR